MLALCLLISHQVVQVYISWPQLDVTLPRWQLVGFNRTSVKQKQKATVSFEIAASQMAVWIDSDKGFVIESGKLRIKILKLN